MYLLLRVCIRLFMAIMVANVVSASVLTFWGGSWAQLPVVYVVSFLVGLGLLGPVMKPTSWGHGLSKKWLYFIIISLILSVVAVRIPYMLDVFFGQSSTSVTGDDLWHVQELLSLTLSHQFPPLYGVFSQDYLLFYYSPWMLMAMLMAWLPGPIASAKFAYALGYGIYVVLTIPIAFAVMRRISQNSAQFWMLVFLVVGHAGMQSFNVFSFPFVSHENWMGHYRVYVQFSAFSTLFLWVIHHVIAAVTLILAYLIYSDHRTGLGPLAYCRLCLTLGVLCAAAAMSSPFVCLGALPLGLWVIWRDRKVVFPLLLVLLCVAIVVVFPLLWMYMQKSSDFRALVAMQSFFEGKWAFFPNLSLSFLVFLVLIVMEFVVPVALWVRLRRAGIVLDFQDKVLLGIAVGIILSTFFVGYGIYNNYAMRATILPVWVGLFVLARYSDRLPALTAKKRAFAWFFMGCMVLGSVNEIGSVAKASVEEMQHFFAGDASRKRVFEINQAYKYTKNLLPLSVSDRELLGQKIRDTNARYVMLLERPLDFTMGYHENDEDLIGPPPSGIWKRLDWYR